MKTVDPYYEWLGIPPKDQPPNHYRLLGLELFEENRSVIDAAANRQMSFIKEYQAGADSELSQKLLNELSAARLCLLSAPAKATYWFEHSAHLSYMEEPGATLITLVFVPTVYTVFEEGWKGLRRGLRHEAPNAESGD